MYLWLTLPVGVLSVVAWLLGERAGYRRAKRELEPHFKLPDPATCKHEWLDVSKDGVQTCRICLISRRVFPEPVFRAFDICAGTTDGKHVWEVRYASKVRAFDPPGEIFSRCKVCGLERHSR